MRLTNENRLIAIGQLRAGLSAREVARRHGVSYDGKTELHVVDGNLNSQKYRDNILEPIVVPYAGAIGPDRFIFQDDNARPHRARIIHAFLEEQGIEHLDWPSKSPDLSPIENLWKVLRAKVCERLRPHHRLDDLPQLLHEAWERIPQQLVRRLISTMHKRCRECIAHEGGHTHY